MSHGRGDDASDPKHALTAAESDDCGGPIRNSSPKVIAPMKPERQQNWGDLRAPAWPLTFQIMHSQTITAIQIEGQC